MRLKIVRHILLLLIGFPFYGQSQGLPIFQIDSVKTYTDFTSHYASYWIDEAATADIDYILKNEATLNFQSVDPKLPNTKKVYWCKWRLQNVMKDPAVVHDWFMDIGKADFGDVYFVNSGGQIIEHQVIGELVPMSKKTLHKKHFKERISFSLTHSDPISVYIRLQRVCGFPPQLKLELHQNDFYNREGYQTKVPERWLFFGMLFTLAFLGLIFYFTTRDKAFLYYGLFLLSLGAYMVDAFFNQFSVFAIFREHPKWVMYWVYALVTLMNVSHVMFIREYIHSKINFPKWDRVAYLVVLFNIVMGVAAIGFYAWTTDEFFTDKVIIPLIIATYIFLFTIIIPILWYKQWSVENLLIFTSVTLFTVAVLINAISIFNGTNLRFVETQLLLTLVILIFAIGLAFGLGYRLHRAQRERLEVQRLSDLGELKAQFYQNITHEFRTPLTVISGLTEQLQEETTISRFPKISKKIETIRRNGQNLLHLVNRLLEMARLETGKAEINMGYGDIILYLRYLLESIESFADQRNVKLQMLTKLESLEMDYDQEKLRQVITNLLSNAIKFSKENGHVTMLVEKTMHKNKEQLLIQVKDEGVGIAPEDLPHIFERFYQGDKSYVSTNQGTGIGLALTKELVNMMDGHIKMESKLGKGTVANLYLSIREEAKETASYTNKEPFTKDNATTKEKISPFANEGEQRPLILLVEDNRDVLEFVKSILDKNYDIEIARDGQQGVDTAIEKIPDLIVSDVKMPEKNGFELTEQLKNDGRTSHIPIILLTAKNTEQDKMEGLIHGADAYLTKPFSPEELEVRIHNILTLRQKLQIQWSRIKVTPENEEKTISEKDLAFLDTLTKFIESNIADEDLDVARMQRAVHMSRPQLHRKLKALTGMSAAKFRKKIRLQKAYSLLQEKDGTIAEVAYAVGYKHPSHFSSDFKETYGVPPGQV